MKLTDRNHQHGAPPGPVFVPPDLSPEAMQRYAQEARRLRAKTIRHFARAVAGYTGRGLSRLLERTGPKRDQAAAGQTRRGGGLRRLLAKLALGRARRAAIAELSRLSDRTLEDIGVSRGQIPLVVDQMLERSRLGKSTAPTPRLAPVKARPAARAPATDDACCPPLAA